MHEALSLLRYTASGNSPQLCLKKLTAVEGQSTPWGGKMSSSFSQALYTRACSGKPELSPHRKRNGELRHGQA